MKIRLLCVGKPREPLFVQLHDRYAERLAPLGVRYSTDWVPDVKPGGRYSKEHALEREARLLLERVEDNQKIVVLHVAGRLVTSDELAESLEHWASPGLTLIVGGPLGVHSSVLQRAKRKWSLSPLTFPHELVRGLVAEQLYRAMTIRRRMPYHK